MSFLLFFLHLTYLNIFSKYLQYHIQFAAKASHINSAGPLKKTASPLPFQLIVNVPPGTSAKTLFSIPFCCMAQTAAAHAPVPHESVSLEPRSQIRRQILL